MKIDSWRQFLNRYSKCSHAIPFNVPSYSEVPLRMCLVPIFLSVFLITSVFFLKKAFFIISRVSSIGTLVKSDSTSIEIIKFSSSNLILLTLFIKSKVSFNVYLKCFFGGHHWLLIILLMLLLLLLLLIRLTVCEIVWLLKWSWRILHK